METSTVGQPTWIEFPPFNEEILGVGNSMHEAKRHRKWP